MPSFSDVGPSDSTQVLVALTEPCPFPPNLRHPLNVLPGPDPP